MKHFNFLRMSWYADTLHLLSTFTRPDSVLVPCRCRVLPILLLCLTLGVGQMWGATRTGWTRVSDADEITAGGTFIIGWENSANSNTIVPMINKPSTLSAISTKSNSYLYSGTNTDATGNGTIDMSDKGSGSTSNYEFEIVSGSATGKISIKLSDNTYLGFWGSSNNNCKRCASVCDSSSFTPTVSSDIVTLTNVKFTGRKLNFNNSSTAYRFSNYSSSAKIVMYKKTSTCSKSVTLSKGTATNGTVNTISSSSVATCSSTASDRRVTVTITPAACFNAPDALTFTKSTGTVTATMQGTKTDNGDGTFSYVYQFAQDDNGSGTFGVTCTAKPAGKTVNFDAGAGTYTGGSLTEDCEGAGITLPSAVASGICKGWTTFAGWATAPVTDSTTTSGVTLYAAGDNFVPSSNGQTLYAVYSKSKGGSGFKLSLKVGNTTYYVGAKGDGNYLLAVTNSADAVIFTYENSYLSYDDSGTKKYISITGNNTSLYVTTDKPSVTWTESGSTTYSYLTSAATRYLAFNGGVSPIRFASYNNNSSYPQYFTKHSAATTYYCSDPNCCSSLASIKGSVSWTNPKTAVVGWHKIANVDEDKWTVKYIGNGGSWASATTALNEDAIGSEGSKITLTDCVGSTPGANDSCYTTISNLSCGTAYDFAIIPTPASGYCDASDTIKNTTGGKFKITTNDKAVGGWSTLTTKINSVAVSESCEDATVVITSEPDASHTGSPTVVIKDKNGNDVSTAVSYSNGSFTMPAYDVQVCVTYAAKQCSKLSKPSVSVSGKDTYPYNVTFSWDAVDDADGYYFYLTEKTSGDNAGNTTLTKEDEVDGGYSITINGLEHNTTYTYNVVATSNTPDDFCDSDDDEHDFTTADYPTVKLYYSENGTLSEGVDQKILTNFTLPNTAAECNKTFIGWTTNGSFAGGNSAPDPFIVKNTTWQIPTNANCTLYAVYADVAEASTTWDATAISSLGASDVFVIVGNNGSNYALPNDGGANKPAATAIEVTNGQLSNEPAATLQWNLSGNSTDGYTFYPNGSTTTWLYLLASANDGVRIGSGNDATRKVFTINQGYLYSTLTTNPRMVGIYNSQDWRCYELSNGDPHNNIKNQTFTFYKKNEVEASTTNYSLTCQGKVAKPTITGVTGGQTYEEDQTVTITSATADATIKYTTDGSDPASSATTMVSGSSFTLSTNGTYTIRAIAVKADMTNSDEATPVSNVTIEKPFTTIKALIDAELTEGTSKKITFTTESNAIITAVNSNNRYIQDKSGYGILIRPKDKNNNAHLWDDAATQSKKITGTITGEWAIYEGQMQLQATAFADMTFTDDELPTATTVTAIDATNFATHPTALVKLESVTFASETFSSRNVTINKGNASYTLRDGVYIFGHMDNNNYVQDYDLPLSSTTCDVTGLLIRYTKDYSTSYQLVPVVVSGISTKGTLATLPELTGEEGGNSSGSATEVASGETIELTAATGFVTTYQVGEDTPSEVSTSGTEVAITGSNDDIITITIAASRDFYTNNSRTYYYKINNAMTKYNIAKSATNGTFTVKNSVGTTITSSVSGETITLAANAADNYHLASWKITNTDTEADVTSSVSLSSNTNKDATFVMPTYDVTVSATFVEDDYATVTFLPGEATSGSAPSSIAKAYVGKTITMPNNGTLSLAGHTFAGWKRGNNTYPEGDNTYVITTDDHTAGTISFTAQWEPYPWAGNGKWELVTDASTLAANDYLVMACTSQSVVAGLTLNDSKRLEDVAATFSGTQATNLGADAAILKLGGTSSAWTLTNQNEVKLTCTAVKEVKWNNTTGTNTWTIAIDAENEYKATITNTGSGLGRFLYNSQSTYFTTYTSDPNNQMILPRLYRFVAGNYFTITYAKGTDDEVSNLPTAQVTESDGTKTLSNDKPICVGYTFLGWKDQDNNEYQPGDEVTLTKNVTLTAQWEEATAHSLSYDLNGGSIKSGTVPSSTNYYPDAVVTITDAVLENGDLLFVGWTYKGDTYGAGSSFTMPNEKVVLKAKFANGAMYTIASKTTVTATGEPEGADITKSYGQTYNTAGQATGNNSMTLSLSGYTGYTIKSVIMNMKSNGSSGTGTLSVSIGGNEVANQSNADRWFGVNAFYTSSYTDINVSMEPTFVKSGQSIVIEIAATQNSLYCTSFTIEYEKSVEINGDDIDFDDILAGSDVVIGNSGVMEVETDKTLHDVTIQSTSGAFEVDGTSGQLSGSGTLTVTGDLYLEIKLRDGDMDAEASRKWYCISAPFDVAINGGFFWGDGTPMVLNTHFQLFEWDGDRRATGASGWRRTSSNMQAGVAYFIGFDDARSNQNTIKLKAMSNTISNVGEITAPGHSGSADAETYGNWNGLGNPNFHHIALDKNVQAFDYNEQAYSPYATGAYNFVVGTPFFIQYAGDIAVSAANGSNPYRAPQRESETYSYCVRIGSAEASRADNRIYVRASETASTEFDNEHDMITMNGTSSSYGALLWTENYGGKRLAIEEAPLVNGTASYVLTLSAPANGTYSISVAAAQENADLYLTYEGAIIWNLSMGAYTMDLNKGITNGYGLLLQAKAPNAATGIEDSVFSDQSSAVQKVIIDEHVYILRGGQMYDVNGKMVK